MSQWGELATSLYELFRDLKISGFTDAEALSLTSDVAKTIAVEGLRKG